MSVARAYGVMNVEVERAFWRGGYYGHTIPVLILAVTKCPKQDLGAVSASTEVQVDDKVGSRVV